MRVWYEQDDADTFTMRLGPMVLNDADDVASLRRAQHAVAEPLLRERGGTRWWCFIDFDGFVLKAGAVGPFATYARETVERYFLGVIRYRTSSPATDETTEQVRRSARAARIPSLVYGSRDEAELAMATLKKHPPRPMEP